MSFIVQDLLDFAQIKAGKFRKSLKYFDIKNTVKEAMGILKTKADAKNISLECQFENLEEELIYHDE